MIETLENTPVEIDLLIQGRSTGWSVDGNKAIHESCNHGKNYLISEELTSGNNYIISYKVTIASGSIAAYVGTTAGATRTTSGFYIETILAAGTNPRLSFDATGNCEIEILDIKEQVIITSEYKPESLVFSPLSAKWTTKLTYTPDSSISMFTNVLSYKNGLPYVSKTTSETRNKFFGIDYDSTITLIGNKTPQQTKTFQSLEYKSNMLLITTEDGVKTNLGQVSDLFEDDFKKYSLISGVTQVDVYDAEGNYRASFLRDKNVDIINGTRLKGNTIEITLKTTENTKLALFLVDVNSVASFT